MLNASNDYRIVPAELHVELLEYFSRSIYRSNNIEDILWDICTNCIRHLNFEDCVIYLKDDTGQFLQQRAAYGEGKSAGNMVLNPIDIPLGQGIVGTVGLTGEAEIVDDTTTDKRYIVDDRARLSELAVPVIFENQVIGVIDSEHSQRGFFNPSHVRLLSNIAAVCAHKIAWLQTNHAMQLAASFQFSNPHPTLRIDRQGKVIDYNLAALELLVSMDWDGDMIQDTECLEVLKNMKVNEPSSFLANNGLKYWKVSCLYAESTHSVFVYATEVTDLIEARQEAEQARTDKALFLSAMSHEIRTPLHAIISLTDLMARTALDEKQKEYIRMLRFSGKNLLNLVNDILEFERIDVVENENAGSAFELDSTVGTLVESFTGLAQSRGVSLEHNLQPISRLFVKGDEQKVTQLLTNLLGNALKFTDKGKVVLNSAAELVTETRVVVTLQIEDTGIGIPEARLNDIFEAFKVGHTESRKRGGTGLGLAISKKIVESLNGTIAVNSKEGVGSKFSVSLPFDLVQPEFNTNRVDAPAGSLHGRRILVVDDNEVNLLVACTFLRQWGAVPLQAESGYKALQIVRQTAVDAVLMDIQMPEMDGIETTKLYLQMTDISHAPVIGLTADIYPDTHDTAREAGMEDVITKPFSPAALAAILGQLTWVKKNT
ncbi:MAG: hypothetical protein RL226_69 [Bacteroidota bacterium]|jgi:signal transduction histidine kinase